MWPTPGGLPIQGFPELTEEPVRLQEIIVMFRIKQINHGRLTSADVGTPQSEDVPV
jgi:hypothetical protein